MARTLTIIFLGGAIGYITEEKFPLNSFILEFFFQKYSPSLPQAI